MLETLIEKPDPPAALAASVASPEEAAQVYLAAFIAIDADTPVERAWLDDLAEKLALDPRLRANLEAAGDAALGQAALARRIRAITCKLRACLRDRADSRMARRAAISSLRWRTYGAETVEHDGLALAQTCCGRANSFWNWSNLRLFTWTTSASS